MKNHFKILKLLIICPLFIFSSCEEWVETDFPSNQLNSEQVFENAQTAFAALDNLYAGLRDMSLFSGTQSGAGALLGSYTDELDCYFNDQNGYFQIYLNQLNSTNQVVESTWNTAYQLIYVANSIVEGAKNSQNLSVEDKNKLQGEAITIRSLLYFYLQQIFGDIPYTISVDYEYNRTLHKTQKDELLMQLINDLKEAEELLNDDYRSPERVYINKKIPQLLIAKIALTIGDYEQAELYARTVVESNLYEFQSNIHEVFHYGNGHIIWQFKPNTAFYPLWEAILYYFEGAPPNKYTLTENLVNSFDSADLRKQYWIKSVTVENQTWFRPYKYKNHTENPNEYSIVFRIEEVYFILAEALAFQNELNEATFYLNFTRIRAGIPELNNLSFTNFIDELLAEKRREFFTEFGFRFIDLKRMNRLDELILVKPNWVDYKSLWPIPSKELLLNPNLQPQNNGY